MFGVLTAISPSIRRRTAVVAASAALFGPMAAPADATLAVAWTSAGTNMDCVPSPGSVLFPCLVLSGGATMYLENGAMWCNAVAVVGTTTSVRCYNMAGANVGSTTAGTVSSASTLLTGPANAARTTVCIEATSRLNGLTYNHDACFPGFPVAV